jgi:arylsulfatase A-like enzyme
VHLEPTSADPILRGADPVDEKEHLTDAITREALAYIDRHKASPFFLYLTYNAVHLPLEPDPKYLERFSNIADERRRGYAAQLSKLDDGIGRVLAKLRDNGLEQDTLIVFISDNGGPTDRNGSSNGPLRDTKGTVYEGGVRVPYFIQWKGHIPEGITYDKPVISLDIFPTVAAAAQASLPGDRIIDGVNLLPFVTGRNAAQPHEFLYWRFGEQWAVRNKDWKLLRSKGEEHLFNLSEDLSESKDLLSQQTEAAKTLREAFAEWEANLIPPLWKQGTAKRG